MVHTVTYPSAILDLHFSPHKPTIFAVASSTGSISLYTLSTDPRHSLIHLHTFSVFPTSTLVLSLAWHPTHPLILGVTLSTSTIALLRFSQAYDSLSILREDISPHDGLEAWTLAFTPSFPNTRSMPQAVYSGGDDSKLRCLTFPSLASLAQKPEELVDLSAGGKMGMRGHSAGVTAILPLPIGTEAGKDILLTGSYDDSVRVLAVSDYRPGQNGKPRVLVEKNLGGGVWRLKFLREYTRGKAPAADEERRFRVLASCMHAGARVLEVVGSREGEWRIEVLGEFTEHESMNYGSDVLPIVAGVEEERLNDSEAICVSTSFYDRKLCVWRWKSK
jgi:diphthamide biosynthesis protein 7